MHNESVTRRLLAAVTVGVAVLLAWYVVRLDRRVGERLGGDAGHAHSRFFTAPFRITAGLDVGVVLQRLDDLGYRNDRELAAPGTWRRRTRALDVRLRALPDVDAQDARGTDRARNRAPALEGRDPRAVPERGVPRPCRSDERRRRRGGSADVLRQARRRSDARRGGDDRRHHPRAERELAAA